MRVISPAIADTAREFAAWWLSELRGLLPFRKAADGRATISPVFTREAEGWRLLLPDGRELDEIAISDWSVEHQQPVAIRIGPDDRLQRSLTLPVASKAKLLAMARLDLERSTPLRSHDIFDELLVESYDRKARQVKVRHIVVTRERVEKYRDKASELGLEVTLLSLTAETSDPNDRLSTSSLGSELLPTRTPSRRLAVVLWTGSTALALAAIGLQISHGLSEVERLDAAIEARKDKTKTVLAAIEAASSNTKRTNTSATEINTYSPVVLTLNQLTRVLPDNVSIFSLKVSSTSVEFTSLAPSAAAVVQLIEESDSFDNPALTSPINRDTQLQRERFTLILHSRND